MNIIMTMAAVTAITSTTVTVDLGEAKCAAAKDLWGIFFEDIDLSLDGGVYAEMVRNRSFEDGNGKGNELTLEYWNPVGGAEYFLANEKPVSKKNPSASTSGCRTKRTCYGLLRAAIGEAAFMLGLERNQDQVKLAAYAPLFANAQHTVWTPNLIYPMTLGLIDSSIRRFRAGSEKSDLYRGKRRCAQFAREAGDAQGSRRYDHARRFGFASSALAHHSKDRSTS